MVTIVKHEWHQVDSQFTIDVAEELLSEIYPDLSQEEISSKLTELAAGELDIEELVADALENNVELAWDRFNDDWWTERKGGFDVTYELEDAS